MAFVPLIVLVRPLNRALYHKLLHAVVGARAAMHAQRSAPAPARLTHAAHAAPQRCGAPCAWRCRSA